LKIRAREDRGGNLKKSLSRMSCERKIERIGEEKKDKNRRKTMFMKDTNT